MEYKYEPIESLALRNFRKIKEATIDFTQSPIVVIIGANGIGKSAFSFGAKALGSNVQAKKYKNYIRSKQTEWEALFVTKSHIVHRIKSKTGQRIALYQRMEDGSSKTLYSIDKMDGSNFPPEVDAITGYYFEPETKQLLTVRTYKDQLIFVDTPTSINYKVVYDALKVESFSQGSQYGVKEVNKFEGKQRELTSEIATRNEQLRKLRVVDVEPLLKIRMALQTRLKALDVVEQLKNAVAERNKLLLEASYLQELSKLQPVSTDMVSSLNRGLNIVYELKQLRSEEKLNLEVAKLRLADDKALSVLETLSTAIKQRAELDTQGMQLIRAIAPVSNESIRVLSGLKTLKELCGQVAVLQSSTDTSVLELRVYNVSILEKLQMLGTCLSDKTKAQQAVKKYQKQAEELHKKLHECGALTGTCPKCGELVIIEQ